MFGEENMKNTVRIDLRGVKIAGRKPRLMDMCGFLEKGLNLDVDLQVKYMNVCPVRPVCYVELVEEEKAEEMGRALREGVSWASGAVYGQRVDARTKVLNVKGVGSGEGEEEVKKVLEKYVEVLHVRRKTLEEYPRLDIGEYEVEVEKGEEEKVPPFIGVGETVWKIMWWGQRQFFGCWKCLKEGHQGWQCKEKEGKKEKEKEKEKVIEEIGTEEVDEENVEMKETFEEEEEREKEDREIREFVQEMVQDVKDDEVFEKDKNKRKGSGILSPQEREKKGKKELTEEEIEQMKNPQGGREEGIRRKTRQFDRKKKEKIDAEVRKLSEQMEFTSTTDLREEGYLKVLEKHPEEVMPGVQMLYKKDRGLMVREKKKV